MKLMKMLPESGIDYPSKYGPVFFTSGCNFKCGFCYNSRNNDELTSKRLGEVLRSLEIKSREGWYNGVCICGGEPTIQPDLMEFIARLKKMKLAVKLDTNGSGPEVLEKLLAEKLVDYVAMDVKGPRELYPLITGVNANVSKTEESMKLVQKFPDYEFRTTLDPRLKTEDIKKTAQWIAEVTKSNQHKYFIQPFIPVKDELIDHDLEKFLETGKKVLEEALAEARAYLPKTTVR